MKRININPGDNPAKTYGIFVKNLELIAGEEKVSGVINKFITDLKHYNQTDYEKKVPIDITGIMSSRTKTDLIIYLSRVKGIYEQKEKEAKRKEKRDEKKEINKAAMAEIDNKLEVIQKDLTNKTLEEISTLLIDIKEGKSEYVFSNSKEKKIILSRIEEIYFQIEEKEKAQTAMKEIEQKLNEKETTIEQRIKYFTDIKEMINSKTNMKITLKEKLLNMIDQKIELENILLKDNLYFEQVKEFTRGFNFLETNPDVINATHGMKNVKFINFELHERYVNLRNKLQNKRGSEIERINELLEDKETENADRRILEARKEVIEKEIEKRKNEGR